MARKEKPTEKIRTCLRRCACQHGRGLVKCMKQKHPIAALVIVATLLATAAVFYFNKRFDLEDFSLASAQLANKPLAMPEKGELDFRFQQFTAWERQSMPIIGRIDAPMGSESGALTYNAQPFWSMNKARGGYHTGDDLNGIGGMNTDLGDPVYAVTDGMVVYSGEPSPGWGNILILGHRLADGRFFQSMYAHLHETFPPLGTMVGRGQKIALVGTAHGAYPAHLHYEIRCGHGADIGAGYAEQRLNRVDPSDFSAACRAAEDALEASVTTLKLRE